MADQRSTLTLALVDQISGPGAAAGRTLSALGVNARNLKGVLAGLGLAFGAAEMARLAKESVVAYAEHADAMARLATQFNVTTGVMRDAHEEMSKVWQRTGQTKEELEAAMGVLAERHVSLRNALLILPQAAEAALVANTTVDKMARLAPLYVGELRAPLADLKEMFAMTAETALHVPQGFAAMEEQLHRVIPMLPRLGWWGKEGLRQFLAYSRIVAPTMGDDIGRAMAAVADSVDLMLSPKVRKRFQDVGIDLIGQIKDGVAKGGNPFELFVQLGEEAIRKAGDVGRVFISTEERQLFEALQKHKGDLAATLRELNEAGGHFSEDLAKRLESPGTKIGQLREAWRTFKEDLGATIVDIGALDWLKNYTEVVKSWGEVVKLLRTPTPPLAEAAQPAAPKTVAEYDERRFGRRALGPSTRAPAELPPFTLSDVRSALGEPPAASPAVAPPPAAPASASVPAIPAEANQAFFGRLRPARRMSNEQIEAAIPPPMEAAPVDLSDVLGRMPEAAKDAGTATGQAFNAALGTELNHSVSMIQQFTDWASKALGFRATPQIAPSFSTATGSQGPGSRASALGRGAFSDSGTVPVR